MKREDMNTLQRGLFAALVLMSSTAQTALQNDRTFIAHRDDIANIGMDWVTKNHYQGRGDHTTMGASLTVTPFHARSTNHADLARLWYGRYRSGRITYNTVTRSTMHTDLYSFNIDHSPNSDGASPNQVPMSGTARFKPERHVSGIHINYEHSLDTILRGLRFIVQAPLTEVSTTMRQHSLQK